MRVKLYKSDNWETLEEYLQQNCIGESSFFGYEFNTKEACIIASATGYGEKFISYYPKENICYMNGEEKIIFK